MMALCKRCPTFLQPYDAPLCEDCIEREVIWRVARMDPCLHPCPPKWTPKLCPECVDQVYKQVVLSELLEQSDEPPIILVRVFSAPPI